MDEPYDATSPVSSKFAPILIVSPLASVLGAPPLSVFVLVPVPLLELVLAPHPANAPTTKDVAKKIEANLFSLFLFHELSPYCCLEDKNSNIFNYRTS